MVNFSFAELSEFKAAVCVKVCAQYYQVHSKPLSHLPLTIYGIILVQHGARKRGGRSIRVPMKQPAEERHPHNPEVEPRGPVGDVVEVVLHALPQGRVPAPAVDLGPAGDAGLVDSAENDCAGAGYATSAPRRAVSSPSCQFTAASNSSSSISQIAPGSVPRATTAKLATSCPNRISGHA